MARERFNPARPDSSAPAGPVRTCVGCRTRATKSELLRMTAGSDADGRPAVVPDPDGNATGRGAHLHPTIACYDLAVRRKALPRALRVTGSPLSVDLLGEYLDSHHSHDQQ